jgi:uncharacterized protein (DUF1778 family)
MGRVISGKAKAKAQDDRLDAALRTGEELPTIRLNARDSRVFAKALLDPREPNARLKAAAGRYLRLLGS